MRLQPNRIHGQERIVTKKIIDNEIYKYNVYSNIQSTINIIFNVILYNRYSRL